MNLREHLESIYVNHGVLTPSVVVEEATPPDHPLHHRFEWDDGVAAHQYRLTQAGDLIRSVKIRFATGDGHPHHVRAFVNVQRSGQVYEPVQEVLADPLRHAMLVREMQREWQEFKARYEDMEEFSRLDFPQTG